MSELLVAVQVSELGRSCGGGRDGGSGGSSEETTAGVQGESVKEEELNDRRGVAPVR